MKLSDKVLNVWYYSRYILIALVIAFLLFMALAGLSHPFEIELNVREAREQMEREARQDRSSRHQSTESDRRAEQPSLKDKDGTETT